MFKKAHSGRDAFTFSLQGIRTIASFTAVPVVPDDRLNAAIERRLSGRDSDSRDFLRQVEDFLARYFVPGQCPNTQERQAA